jgi:hypothetical protein
MFQYKNYITIFYNVPFCEKERAKPYKLKWNPDKKSWYSKHLIVNNESLFSTDGICPLFPIVKYKFDYEYDQKIKDKIFDEVNNYIAQKKYEIEHKDEIEQQIEEEMIKRILLKDKKKMNSITIEI